MPDQLARFFPLGKRGSLPITASALSGFAILEILDVLDDAVDGGVQVFC